MHARLSQTEERRVSVRSTWTGATLSRGPLSSVLDMASATSLSIGTKCSSLNRFVLRVSSIGPPFCGPRVPARRVPLLSITYETMISRFLSAFEIVDVSAAGPCRDFFSICLQFIDAVTSYRTIVPEQAQAGHVHPRREVCERVSWYRQHTQGLSKSGGGNRYSIDRRRRGSSRRLKDVGLPVY